MNYAVVSVVGIPITIPRTLFIISTISRMADQSLAAAEEQYNELVLMSAM